MSGRESNILHVRDILEHLSFCQKQLEWAEDRETIAILTETMLRELARCQRVCSTIHRGVSNQLVS